MMYNPMIDYKRNELMAQQAMIQQQLAQLNQMTPPINQPVTQPIPVSQTQYFVKEVSGFDEAKKIVPNLGQVFVLIDGKDGKIYLKQMNPDTGKSDYLFYNIDNTEASTEKDPITLIDERLSNIERAIGDMRNESIPGNAAVSKHGKKSDGGITTADVATNAKSEPADVSAGSANDKRKE